MKAELTQPNDKCNEKPATTLEVDLKERLNEGEDPYSKHFADANMCQNMTTFLASCAEIHYSFAEQIIMTILKGSTLSGKQIVVVVIDRGVVRGRSHNDTPPTFTFLGAAHRFDSAEFNRAGSFLMFALNVHDSQPYNNTSMSMARSRRSLERNAIKRQEFTVSKATLTLLVWVS